MIQSMEKVLVAALGGLLLGALAGAAEEEKRTDEKLTQLAERGVNQKARK